MIFTNLTNHFTYYFEGITIYGMVHDKPALVLTSLQEGGYVNVRTSAGWTPIIYASFYG